MITLGAVTLPDDIQWLDEFAWNAVAMQQELTLDGALLLEYSAQQAGRPITLSSGSDRAGRYAVASRATVEALHALANATHDEPFALAGLREGLVWSVRWRYAEGPAFEARPLRHVMPPAAEDLYEITLRLIAVGAHAGAPEEP